MARKLDRDALTRKQLFRSVTEGRLVTCYVSHPEFGPVQGYVCGMDDFHWMLVTPDGEKYLLHKGSIAVIELHDDSTYAAEDNRRDLEQVVAPFRGWVEREWGTRKQPEQQGDLCSTSTPALTATA